MSDPTPPSDHTDPRPGERPAGEPEPARRLRAVRPAASTSPSTAQILAELDAGAVLDELHAEHDNAMPTAEAPAKGGGDDGKGSQASRLVALAEESYDLVLGDDGRPYAVDRDGPAIAVPLRGREGLRTRLARTFYARTGAAPSASALADALAVIEGMTADAEPVPVALRVAAHPTAPGAVVLDLGDPTGRVVVVEPGRWHLAETSPVLFRRTALTQALPVPGLGAGLADFRALLNVDDAGFGLVVGWLLAALLPGIPHPILALTGEQGTAKSTAARFLVSLVDPSPAPLRTPPRDVRQWAVTAAASWTVALDNVSTIPAWLSDTLCKAVTGDGIVDRALFTDDDVTVLSFRRVIAMTSIDAGALAGDLAERLVPVELHRIDPEKRRPDEAVNAAFRAAQPGTLGALLDLLADVLAALPAVRLEQLPRMADFARLLAALDAVTGWATLAAYTAGAADVTAAVLEADPLATAIRQLLDGQAVGWTGTAAQLLEQVTPLTPPRGWPRTPRALSGQLRRLAPALREAGIGLDFTKSSDRTGARLVVLTQERKGEQPSEPSERSEHPP